MKKQSYDQAVPVRIAHPLFSVTTMAQAAMIAALYVVLTFIANAFGLANHAAQFYKLTEHGATAAFLSAASSAIF